MIKIVDKFLTQPEYEIVDKIRFYPGYMYGENDLYPEHDPIMNGMSLTLEPDHEVYKIFSDKIDRTFQEVQGMSIFRMYVNCFAPSEWSFYHTDTDDYSITFLYYLNNSWDINEGGETHFYINDKITAIPPVPNRLVYFDGRLLHKATPFRTRHRFSVAVKYS
jgi:Rps23 Pro-64 3,4-dihydroxylase Tpa1-like proline 4-hydroxylase